MALSTAPRTLVFRRPRRITITVPHHAFSALQQRSDLEGRSLSNLAAYLLETCLDQDGLVNRCHVCKTAAATVTAGSNVGSTPTG